MSRFVFLAVAKTAVVASVVIFAGTSTGLGRDSTPKGNAIQRGSRSYGMLPLVFEANQGQTDAKAKFIARGAGYSIFLTPEEAVLSLRRIESMGALAGFARETSAVLRMRMEGGNPSALLTGHAELAGKSNYFIGSDRRQWHTNIPTFRRVTEHDLYPGIDLVYHGLQQRLEYDFVVAPRANPSAISIAFDGASALRIDEKTGDLVLTVSDSEVRFHAPIAYQQINGRRENIKSRYIQTGKAQVGFEIGSYNKSRALVIDPVLAYSTFLGGHSSDVAIDVAVDATGNAYVSGYTASSDFPYVNGFQSSNHSSGPCSGHTCSTTNAFVAKLNPAGTALVYSTFLGGSKPVLGRGVADIAFRIAVDSKGNAYVTGRASSTDFPTTASAFQKTFPINSLSVPFVTKLNPQGSALVYSTFVGGANGFFDMGTGIAVDSAGSAYITGVTFSNNFPTTPGALQPKCKPFPGQTTCSMDAFVTKVNPAGSALTYSTFLGGSGSDAASGIAVDGAGNAYVTGGTLSTDFPTTPGAFQVVNHGNQANVSCMHVPHLPCGDAFISKVNPSGSKLLYSTYLGGSGSEFALDIKLDASGSAYVTGYTASSNFPTTIGAFQTTFADQPLSRDPSGHADVFITKLNPAGSGLTYSTYLGGSDSDVGLALAIDKGGNAYVSGITASPDFPLRAPLQNTLGASGNDFLSHQSAFVAELNSAGTALRFSSYLGDNAGFDAVGSMFAGGIALDASNNVYVAGLTESIAFTITHGAFQTSCKLDSFGICTDAFVSKITFPASPAVLLTNRAPTFAPLLLGKTSALSLKVLNQGTAVLNISSVKFNCPAPSCTELRLSSNGCGSAVPAGSSCALQISFSPNKEGDQFASLTLVDNASISPQSVNITANGTVFTASPGLIVFAPQKVGTTSPPQIITLVNHSSATISLSITTILFRDYKVAATCSSIAANATCKTTVTFTPQFVGPRPDLVTFTDANAGQGLVNLSGSGK